MDKPIPEAVRKQFETWARPKWRHREDFDQRIGAPHGTYNNIEVQAAWEAWQALTAAQQQGQAAPDLVEAEGEIYARREVEPEILHEFRPVTAPAPSAPVGVDGEECPHSEIGGCDICAAQHQEPKS